MKILVAEDDLMLADCLTDGLMYDGHDVCGVAATVAEAVALARLHHPDVAILDMHMRDGERGCDIADQLAASGDLGRMAILYISGKALSVHQEARIGHACLSKPYTLDTLSAALAIVAEVALDGRTNRPLPRGLRLMHRPFEVLLPAA